MSLKNVLYIRTVLAFDDALVTGQVLSVMEAMKVVMSAGNAAVLENWQHVNGMTAVLVTEVSGLTYVVFHVLIPAKSV